MRIKYFIILLLGLTSCVSNHDFLESYHKNCFNKGFRYYIRKKTRIYVKKQTNIETHYLSLFLNENHIDLSDFYKSNDTIYLFYIKHYTSYSYQFVYKEINKSFYFLTSYGNENKLFYSKRDYFDETVVSYFKNGNLKEIEQENDEFVLDPTYFYCYIFISKKNKIHVKLYSFDPDKIK